MLKKTVFSYLCRCKGCKEQSKDYSTHDDIECLHRNEAASLLAANGTTSEVGGVLNLDFEARIALVKPYFVLFGLPPVYRPTDDLRGEFAKWIVAHSGAHWPIFGKRAQTFEKSHVSKRVKFRPDLESLKFKGRVVTSKGKLKSHYINICRICKPY